MWLPFKQDGTMPDNIAEQARQSLENVKAIVEAAGLSVGQIARRRH
jgi:2-iminobutanoate/2-iminopropanoate deaminase